MPHVVLNGQINMKELFNKLQPLMIKEDGIILKTTETYINNDESIILLNSLVIEKGDKKNFMTAISKRSDGIVVRIHSIKEIERTEQVFRLIAEIGKQIMKEHPSLTIGKTNLQKFL